VQPRIKKLKEWPDHADSFFFGCPDYPASDLAGKKTTPEQVKTILEKTIAFAKAAADWSPKPLEEAGRAAAKELGVKDGDFFMVLRIAAMGKKVSPPLFESMEVLGRDETLARLERARAKLGS
jgi:glutamyl-tRNA synthetase